jgi:hypothetical protein
MPRQLYLLLLETDHPNPSNPREPSRYFWWTHPPIPLPNDPRPSRGESPSPMRPRLSRPSPLLHRPAHRRPTLPTFPFRLPGYTPSRSSPRVPSRRRPKNLPMRSPLFVRSDRLLSRRCLGRSSTSPTLLSQKKKTLSTRRP